MFPSLILALLAAAPAEQPPKAARRFAEDFRALCLSGHRDLAGIRKAAKALRYADTGALRTFPESLMAARRGLILVYRGRLDDPASAAPQCSLQAGNPPGDSLERLAAAVEQILGGTRIESKSRATASFAWSVATPDGPKRVILLDEMLAGRRNIRLSALPPRD